jgi:hypothetical protein
LLVLAISLVTSKGTHGVPGSAIVILAATLSAVPLIPAISLVLVRSADRFIGMVRALGNLRGNCVTTVVVAAWEKEFDLPLGACARQKRGHRRGKGSREAPSAFYVTAGSVEATVSSIAADAPPDHADWYPSTTISGMFGPGLFFWSLIASGRQLFLTAHSAAQETRGGRSTCRTAVIS